MFKKIMSVMLAVMMLMSVLAISASAAQIEIADNSAEAIAEVAADAAADTGADASADTGAEGAADTGAKNVLIFDTTNAGWNNYKKIFCHIWVYGGDAFYAWQAKKEACTDNGDGTWTYDLDAKAVTLEAGTLYACIFSNENGMQTHNLLFDSTVVGDTAYCKDPNLKYENMEDSTKESVAAFWKGQDETKFGPEKGITSIGNVVGTCVPYTTSSQAMFEAFLTDTLANARTYSGKDDQTLLDDTAAALDLKQDNVKTAISTTGVEVDWSADKSSLPSGENEEATKTPTGGTAGGSSSGGSSAGGSSAGGSSAGGSSTGGSSAGATDDGGSSAGGSSGGSGGSAGGSGGSSGGSGGSGGRTGSGSTTQTGQETTVIFIMLGVMLAAGAVVVIARKKDRA